MSVANSIISRCINVDWLEVFVREPSELNAAFFHDRDFSVKSRAYGTPQYREMFTIMDSDGLPVYEVRRNPYSLKQNGGIFDVGSCHIRLSNRECYNPNCIDRLRQFLVDFGYTYNNISRLDLCVDLLRFDDGMLPGDFLYDYIREKFFKLHLSTISPRGTEVTGGEFMAHGTDRQFIREYSSMKWGAPTSAISVKLYDKTKELDEVKDKFYIRDQWMSCGLIDESDNKLMATIRDCHYNINKIRKSMQRVSGDKKRQLRESYNEWQRLLNESKKHVKHVWRVEFSMNSDIKGFAKGDVRDVTERGQQRLYDLNLTAIDNKEKQLHMFHSLASRYFLFKLPSFTRSGQRQRKDRCADYLPIRMLPNEEPYKPVRLNAHEAPSRMDRIFVNKLRAILDDNNERNHYSTEFVNALITLLRYFHYHYRLDELSTAMDETIFKVLNPDDVENPHFMKAGYQIVDDALKWMERKNAM